MAYCSGLNLISTDSFVSTGAAAHFHFPIALTAACTSKGLPPTTSVRVTVPFGATTAINRTVPTTFILFASSG